jgi:hypothetical protein
MTWQPNGMLAQFRTVGVGHIGLLRGRLSRVPETGELEKIDLQWADNRKVIDRVGVNTFPQGAESGGQ